MLRCSPSPSLTAVYSDRDHQIINRIGKLWIYHDSVGTVVWVRKRMWSRTETISLFSSNSIQKHWHLFGFEFYSQTSNAHPSLCTTTAQNMKRKKTQQNWNARTQTQNDDLFIQSKWYFYCVVSGTLLQELRLVSLHSFHPILFNWIEKTVHFPFNTAFIAQCECTIRCVVLCRVPVCLL